MSKNILVFSDGTGQAGGLSPDQSLSNIYKLYRAVRVSPENAIDPAHQIAFYEAGLGTGNDAGDIPLRPLQTFRKFWSAASGTGISRNIADCYEAIIKHYEPGDRIFLFGFSRGAYTARCVGGVMALCGVPTRAADGGPLPRFGRALRAVADEAVTKVYEHGQGSDNPERKLERLEKARRFRARYASGTPEQSNEVPYFIGVFDTVAALGARGWTRVGMLAGLAAGVAAMAALLALGLALLPWFEFWPAFAFIAALLAASLLAGAWRASFKIIHDYPHKGQSRWHFAAWHLRFYDNSLNTRVKYARHALAIDETRLDFAPVEWGNQDAAPPRSAGEQPWLKQVWFAGCHSDIGGSYPEDESRLSDITASWMLGECSALPEPMLVDAGKLQLFGSPVGMQHSEVASFQDAFPAWLPVWLRRGWKEKLRDIADDAPLHPAVVDRFAATAVSHYGVSAPYRPANLRFHRAVSGFYS